MVFHIWLFLGGLDMEGVYRVNGGQLTMKKLRTSFDQGKVLEFLLVKAVFNRVQGFRDVFNMHFLRLFPVAVFLELNLEGKRFCHIHRNFLMHSVLNHFCMAFSHRTDAYLIHDLFLNKKKLTFYHNVDNNDNEW